MPIRMHVSSGETVEMPVHPIRADVKWTALKIYGSVFQMLNRSTPTNPAQSRKRANQGKEKRQKTGKIKERREGEMGERVR